MIHPKLYPFEHYNEIHYFEPTKIEIINDYLYYNFPIESCSSYYVLSYKNQYLQKYEFLFHSSKFLKILYFKYYRYNGIWL